MAGKLTHPERIEAETGVEVGVAPVRNERFGAFIGGAKSVLAGRQPTGFESRTWLRGCQWAEKRRAAAPR